eukprot:scaffold2808_cov255-Pinguiococcus_pyrenoidosus.AAC.24
MANLDLPEERQPRQVALDPQGQRSEKGPPKLGRLPQDTLDVDAADHVAGGRSEGRHRRGEMRISCLP